MTRRSEQVKVGRETEIQRTLTGELRGRTGERGKKTCVSYFSLAGLLQKCQHQSTVTKTRHCCMDEGGPSQAHQMNPYLHILSIPEGQSPAVKLADGRSPLQVLKHETHFSKQGIWPGIGS